MKIPSTNRYTNPPNLGIAKVVIIFYLSKLFFIFFPLERVKHRFDLTEVLSLVIPGSINKGFKDDNLLSVGAR